MKLIKLLGLFLLFVQSTCGCLDSEIKDDVTGECYTCDTVCTSHAPREYCEEAKLTKKCPPPGFIENPTKSPLQNSLDKGVIAFIVIIVVIPAILAVVLLLYCVFCRKKPGEKVPQESPDRTLDEMDTEVSNT